MGARVDSPERLRRSSPGRAAADRRLGAPRILVLGEASIDAFRLLADTSRDVVFRYQLVPTPGFEYVSPSVVALTGYTPDEVCADPEMGFGLVHPDDRQLVDDVLAGRRPPPDPFVVRGQVRDGKETWIDLRVTPFAGPDGAIGFDGVARDVTALRAAEDALRAAREEAARLAALVASTDEAIIGATLDGRVTSWNAAAERLFGYTAGEMLGRSGLRLAPPEDRSSMRQLIGRLAAGGHVDPYETVRLAKDGRRVDVSVSASPVRDASGELTGISVFLRDIGARKSAEEKLAASEARFRALVENVPTGLVAVNADMTTRYLNPAFTSIFGYTLEDVESFDAWLARGFPDPAYRATVVADWSGAQEAADRLGAPQRLVREYRITCADGTVKSAIVSAETIGEALYVAFTDVTAQREAEERRRESDERYRTAFEALAEGVLVLDADGAIVGSNANARRILGFEDDELLARTWSDPRWQAVGEDGLPFRGRPLPAAVALGPGELPPDVVMGIRVATGELRWLRANVVPLPGGSAGQPTRFALSFADVTDQRRLAAERDRLVAIVEQAPDAIGIADAAGTVIYANTAMGALAGLPVTDLVGSPVFAMMRGLPPARHRDMWDGLQRGEAVHGDWRGERPDGSTFRAEGTIAPLRDSAGSIAHYSLTARDVTHVREVEEDLALEASVRAALAEALLEARPTDTLEEAVQRVCDRLGGLPGIDYAGVEVFDGVGGVVVVASCIPAGFALEHGVVLPPAHAAYVRERVPAGPWAEYWEALPEDGVFDTLMRDIGLKAMAVGPIAHEDHVDGLLVIGTRSAEFARTLVERRHALLASSNTSSALLAERLHARRGQTELRRSLGEVIAARAFHPVFQPIVDLASGDVVGYEALTRFDSEQRPDLCFTNAWSVGLGTDLELVTLEEAVAHARALPAGRWLSLNVSARLLEDRARLGEVIWSADRPIVLEITEHEVIADYHAVREAFRSLGHDVRVAVDDAGAGVANFGHIIELQPDLVKLDISLVRRVNANLGRQALVVGMRHFSRTAGCRLIAEGIETDEEARTLVELGVEYGQGYWFGRPDGEEAWASPRPAD